MPPPAAAPAGRSAGALVVEGAAPGTDPISIADVDRAALPSVVAGFLKRGAWNKADLLLVVTREGRWVVKDYGPKGWIVRMIGAVQLGREERAYRALHGMAGIPRLGGKIDRNAIAVAFVEGMRLPKFHKYRRQPRVAASLERLLSGIHARGVIHNDIRSRDNILVTPAGVLYLIDFSSALTFAPEGFRRRFIMPAFRKAERRAFLKWKSAIAPETMTDEEWAEHRRFGLLRRLWPFNPKEDLDVKQARAARREPR